MRRTRRIQFFVFGLRLFTEVDFVFGVQIGQEPAGVQDDIAIVAAIDAEAPHTSQGLRFSVSYSENTATVRQILLAPAMDVVVTAGPFRAHGAKFPNEPMTESVCNFFNVHDDDCRV